MNAAALEQRLERIERMLCQLTAAFSVVPPAVQVVADEVSAVEAAQIRLLARQNVSSGKFAPKKRQGRAA